jgi:hypothetical protein
MPSERLRAQLRHVAAELGVTDEIVPQLERPRETHAAMLDFMRER